MRLDHILLMRTDHLGDMVLTLPMATAVKTAMPSCRITVLASQRNAEAARHHPHVDGVELDPQEARGSNLRGVTGLARRLRRLACDAAVVVHPTPRLAAAARLAGIPRRVGTAYRAYSILFNHRVRQHRRGALDRHEAELNLELLAPLGIQGTAPPRPLWCLRPEESRSAAETLGAHRLEPKRFVVLHPGSAGSSMNWTAKQYAELGKLVAESGLRIAVTGAAAEVELTRAVASEIGAAAVDLGGRFTLGILAAFLAEAAAYAGGSTGPTHLAAAVGTPVVGIYPPLRSTLPQRWRPLGASVRIFQPEVGRVCAKCLHRRCPLFNCMEGRFDPVAVARAVCDAARPPL